MHFEWRGPGFADDVLHFRSGLSEVLNLSLCCLADMHRPVLPLEFRDSIRIFSGLKAYDFIPSDEIRSPLGKTACCDK